MALWGGREIVALILASMVAGLATTPYAAFHFHRLAPYGVIANLLAMPIVSVWVMPMGLLGLIAIPFGFDGLFWRLMGDGIDWMIAVALFVAHLPGAVGRMAAFGVGPLLLGTGGLVVLCLLKTPLRWSGGVADRRREPVGDPHAVAGCAGFHGRAGARGARAPTDGLSVHRTGRDAFAVKEWLAADGDARLPDDKTLGQGFRCDPSGCIASLAGRQARLAGHHARRLRGGLPARGGRGHEPGTAGRVQGARDRPQGFARQRRDCAPPKRRGLRDHGRPAARARPALGARPGRAGRNRCCPPAQPQPRDATPRAEDLEAGD